MPGNLRIDRERLLNRIDALARIGAIDGGGVCRLALGAEDKAGRDQVVAWMRALDLKVAIDGIGNVVGLRPGREDGPPVMTGSHIDTVRTGGRYDGNLGVLAGLEVIETLNAAGIVTHRPLAVAFFTNEEGARFAPDMMGSLVYVGGLDRKQALDTIGIDGARVGDELKRIGYDGDDKDMPATAHAFVELHVEQGPVLEAAGITIGAVEGVQGISWTEFTAHGVSNHAGTTPMRMRHDAGYVAVRIAAFAREIARDFAAEQVATVGLMEFTPNLVNVIASRARFTVDLRNTDAERLRQAEARLFDFAQATAQNEGVRLDRRSLARFEPVAFDPAMIHRVERIAGELGHTTARLPSGAGHDAQMLARICPAGMIFVPSAGGISHNVREHTRPEDIEAGANVLLHMLLELADQ